MRRPCIAKALGIVGDLGLTSVLIGRASLADALQLAGHNLEVLVAGGTPPNPSELLSSEAFRHTLMAIRARVDTVVVDTAPLLPVTDGAQVAALADATVLVVRAAKTSREQVLRAIETLSNVDVTPVGVVLCTTPNQRLDGYFYRESPPDRHANSVVTATDRP